LLIEINLRVDDPVAIIFVPLEVELVLTSLSQTCECSKTSKL